MTTAVFDTLKASRKLKAVGIDEAHAEAIVQSMAEAFEDTVATKADIVSVRADLKTEIAAVRADIEKLKVSTKATIAEVRTELKQDIAIVKGDIRLLKWMIGVILACVAFPILKSFLA